METWTLARGHDGLARQVAFAGRRICRRKGAADEMTGSVKEGGGFLGEVSLVATPSGRLKMVRQDGEPMQADGWVPGREERGGGPA